MAKPLEDRGHLAEATKPLKPRVYHDGNLPDPVQCAGCVIVICNPHDAHRLTLAVSDGSEWVKLGPSVASQPGNAVAPTVDLTALAREAVAVALSDVRQPQMQVVAPVPQIPEGDVRAIAQGLLETSDHVTSLAEQHADLMARVEFLEHHAVAKVQLR